MEYVKGQPYFCLGQEKIKQYPYLEKDMDCYLLIIGGGIDGAIANFYLSQKYDVALVDKGRLGFGCTSCATALLEYQLDEYALDLKSNMSQEEIVLAYRSALKAFDKIENFIKNYGNHSDFYRRPTLLYTNSILNQKSLEEEFNFRINNNFPCQLLDSLTNPFPFEIKKAIYCENGGCELNPYLFTKQMIENSPNQDKIFQNTGVEKIEKTKSGFTITTSFSQKIRCKKVLVATGFNWEVLKENNLCERFISYSIVTNPLENFSWHSHALVHDAESPYHYMRLLPDKRIIFGGEDTPFKGKPINQKLTNKKYKLLEESLYQLFPMLDGKMKVDYQFCGAFGTTVNNLGLIGKSKQDDDLMLFISCGANGIINAMIGTEIIDDIIQNRTNPLYPIFSPRRKNI